MATHQYITTAIIWKKGVEIPVGTVVTLAETEAKYILGSLQPWPGGTTPPGGSDGNGNNVPVAASLTSSYVASTRVLSGKLVADPTNINGAKVLVYFDDADATSLSADVAVDGSWSIVLPQLDDGQHTIRAEAILRVSSTLSIVVKAPHVSVSPNVFAFGLLGAGG